MALYVQGLPPLTHKFSIVKRRLDSQAGRRGFESPLPLHLFNSLEKIRNQALLRLLRFLPETEVNHRLRGVPPSPESRVSLLNHLGFEALHCLDLLLKIAD